MSTAESSSLSPLPAASVTSSHPVALHPDPWSLVKGVRVPAALLLTGLALLFTPVMGDLWNLWMSREDYTHGFLIPLISLYVIRAKWRELSACPIEPHSAAGTVLMLLSLAGICAGLVGGVITLSSVALIGVLAGLVLLLFGVSYLRVLTFPLTFLVFMTPLLDLVVEPLQQPLQRTTALVVSSLFQAAGVPTFLAATSIQFPNGMLEVAVECSGAGFLISTLAIGLPLASLTLHSWPRRLALITAALIMSVIANWARVTVIAALGYLNGWGPQVHGPFHILQGMLVYWVGFGALFLGAWLLAREQPGRPSERIGPHAVEGPARPIGPTWRRQWWTAAVLSLTAILYLRIVDRGPVAASQPYTLFPERIAEWVADQTDETPTPVRIHGPDAVVERVYRNAAGHRVGLYIAYVAAQTQGRELVNDATASLHQHTRATAFTKGGEHLAVNIGYWEYLDGRRSPLLFWYALPGRQIADRRDAKLATIVQSLTRGGSHGALVLLVGLGRREAVQTDEPSTDGLVAFAHDLMTVLPPYMP